MQMIKNLFYQPMDKMTLYYHFFRTLYNNASKVILIEGLPDDADYHFILSQLLLVGKINVFQDKGKTYLLNGNVGGKCDEYYYPTRVIIANPILGSFDLERGKEAVPVYLTPADRILDSPLRTNVLPGGMYSLISMCANVLSECVTTINTTLMNTRVHAIYTADTDSAAKSAEPVLRAIYMGKPYSVVTSELLERLNVNPLSEHGLATTLTETIEVCQYILAMFWNGLGVDMPFNMKRERLVTAEVEKNMQSLIVPVQTILETLNEGFGKANSLFGTSLVAKLNPDFELKDDVAPVQGDDSNAAELSRGADENVSEGTDVHNSGTNEERNNNASNSREDDIQDSGENTSENIFNTSNESGEEGTPNGEDKVNITVNIISGDNNDVTIEDESGALENIDSSSEGEEDEKTSTDDAPVQKSKSDTDSNSDDTSKREEEDE